VRALNILSAADTPINHPAVGLDLLEELVAVPGLFTMAWRPDLDQQPVIWLPLIQAVCARSARDGGSRCTALARASVFIRRGSARS